jgi:hypothetical protein
MITLEQIYLSRGDLEKIYKTSVGVTLWRAVRKEENGADTNPLDPDLKERELPNGRIRLPDVATYKDAAGVTCVRAEEQRGTSLTDKPGLFGHDSWDYVVIPAGTVIPNELIITKDHYIPRRKCWHYSISPNYDMPVTVFLRALDALACNAGIQLKSQRHA